MTLTEFLEARIAEEKAAAANQIDPYNAYFHNITWCYWDADFGGYIKSPYAKHGLGSPARVLLECEVKTRIVAMKMVSVNRLLALPYVEHADYRKEWLP